MDKTAFFTMDVESFCEISCLKQKPRKEYYGFRIEHVIDDYLNLLDKYGIKATFFVLCSSLPYTKEYLTRAAERGHEIALHGLTHDIPAQMDIAEIKRQIAEGKKLLEGEFKTKITGYRAPCFGVTDEVIRTIRELGFEYDSSYIDIKLSYFRSAANFSGYQQAEGGILKDNGFTEISPCKVKTAFGAINVSGGGYLRMAPYSTVKRGIKKFLKNNGYYMFYCHPADMFTEKPPRLKGISALKKHFIKGGRKKFLKRTESIIKLLKDSGYTFSTMANFVKTQNS